MIQTEIKKLDEALNEAITIAGNKQIPQLFSITEMIDYIDPFLFFDQAKHIEGNRVFWASSAENFYLVGAGEAFDICSSVDRFDQTEAKFKAMLAESLIYNSYRVPGTGPIAIGGFSFDPEKEKTRMWQQFPASQFRVPAYLLTIVDGVTYLTINTVVRPEDHQKQMEFNIAKNKKMLLANNTSLPEGPVINSKIEIDPVGWKELVRRATNDIKEEKADKIVLAREMRVTFEKKANISPILSKLTKAQTNSYIFAFENSDSCFLGATPERLVRVEDQHLLSTCLAGTAPRGKNKEEDYQIGLDLLRDVKNREEHEFVVKMIRDAVTACCIDVDVPSQPVLYPLKNLQHLYTPVKARLKSEYTIIDVVKRLHPTPALGGLPKVKSLEYIRENEELDRGWYGAPIGWLDAYKNGEFAVAIRSALIQGTEASLFSGCGVVKDSDPEAEYQETNIKFTPMLSVLGG
ncbi:isochorismate synthase [Aquibacillus halophilus]|uniref:Isochorismate synthase MenF n=1 Tax=Aquibacillus halophilus TaxID=930132 RepID=A0A6A8DHS2_9BACI|nr:isochorismate synthase [Aquibacillus halophilus]MRH44780.1 isochorismate synthase [Aquibacillus halophilus]